MIDLLGIQIDLLGTQFERRRPARYFLRRLWPVTAEQPAENERPMEVQR